MQRRQQAASKITVSLNGITGNYGDGPTAAAETRTEMARDSGSRGICSNEVRAVPGEGATLRGGDCIFQQVGGEEYLTREREKIKKKLKEGKRKMNAVVRS